MTISTAGPPLADPSTAALPSWWPIAGAASQLRALDTERCLQLLPSAGHGWLSYPRQPQALPTSVAYRVRGRAVLVAPGPGCVSALNVAPLVLFRVDHLDADQRGGWSIVAAGPLRAEDDQGTDPSTAVAAAQPELVLDLAHLAGRSVVVRDRPSLRAVQ